MDNLHASLPELGDSNDSFHLEELSGTKEQHIYSSADSVHELGNVFHDTLQVKDGNFSTGSDFPLDDDGSINSEDEILTDDWDMSLDGFVETFSETAQKHNNSDAHSLPLPNTGKLVSAMKGSREKEGVPPRKLSVSWAPDVYDPPPSTLTPHPKIKVQKEFKSNKKHGKGKQKGKAMRGGGSGPKDKKHYCKIGGKSDGCLNFHADTDRVASSKNNKPATYIQDFEDDYDDYDDDIGGAEYEYESRYMGKDW